MLKSVIPLSYLSCAFLFALLRWEGTFALAPILSTISSSSPEFRFPKKVAVAGSTGRAGRLVVRKLLSENVKVVALIRNPEKASEVFSDLDTESHLLIVVCDLASKTDVASACKGCDAAIWCASCLTDAPGAGLVEKLKSLMQVALGPRRTIDSLGIMNLAAAFEGEKDDGLARVVMCSSAGVTRPKWDESKKKKLEGAADIPIVRLNPFGVLNVKAESEEVLRGSGVGYCIVRPSGLNDAWPSGSRPVFTQGDVAVGRSSRKDVAKLLVDVLTCPEAVGKTFEVVMVAKYSPPDSISPALSRLKLDADGPPTEREVEVAYSLMQQLLPGIKQESASLAMGQSYEQFDNDEKGRLGNRGEEDAKAAFVKDL